MKNKTKQSMLFDSGLTRCQGCKKGKVFKKQLDPRTKEPFHPAVGDCTSCDYKKTISDFCKEAPPAYYSGIPFADQWEYEEPQKQSSLVPVGPVSMIDRMPVTLPLGKILFFNQWCSGDTILDDIVKEAEEAHSLSKFVVVSDLVLKYQELLGLSQNKDVNMELLDTLNKFKSLLPSYSVTTYKVDRQNRLHMEHNGFAAFQIPGKYYFGNDCCIRVRNIIKMENAAAVYSLGYDVIILSYIGVALSNEDFRNRCILYRKYLMQYHDFVVSPLSRETEIFHASFDPNITYQLKRKMISWQAFLEKYFPEYK